MNEERRYSENGLLVAVGSDEAALAAIQAYHHEQNNNNHQRVNDDDLDLDLSGARRDQHLLQGSNNIGGGGDGRDGLEECKTGLLMPQ